MSSIFFRTLALMSVLLCGVSADDGISLHCNKTWNVTFGKELNLTCFIKLKLNDCKNVSVEWNDTVGDLCVNNKCMSDNKTFATLQMLNVTKDKNITVTVEAVCGRDSKTVSVKVNPENFQRLESTQSPEEPFSDFAVVIGVVGVVVVVVVVGVVVLYMIFKRKCPPLSSTAESDALTDSV
ncbi:hypothetical protein OJAV_G00187090 [Oryzias javanicus]|uniref:Uncharacterized protein n=1 Tax=Oryzias javanicus TaxID=123683 RepID=A0A437C977_ORYJA|nr:hypothetical protein OJAV_G00187090 [Oryzias javanicus]